MFGVFLRSPELWLGLDRRILNPAAFLLQRLPPYSAIARESHGEYGVAEGAGVGRWRGSWRPNAYATRKYNRKVHNSLLNRL
jgi:hypothetical protein